MQTNLGNLKVKEKGIVINIGGKGPVRRKLIDMGITPGTEITVCKLAPFGDPIQINIRGYELSMRKSEAEQVIIDKIN